MTRLVISVAPFPQNKEVTVLSASGQMDTESSPEFMTELLVALAEKKFKLVVDLKDINYISSAGWGIFTSRLKFIREHDGDLLLAGMNAEVAETYNLLEFENILKAYPTVEKAVAQGFEN